MSENTEKFLAAWEGFAAGDWKTEVNVRDFIQLNYTPMKAMKAS